MEVLESKAKQLFFIYIMIINDTPDLDFFLPGPCIPAVLSASISTPVSAASVYTHKSGLLVYLTPASDSFAWNN